MSLRAFRHSSALTVAGAFLMMACSGAGDELTAPIGSADADGAAEQTVAQVEIERTRTTNGNSAQAMAHFVAAPVGAEGQAAEQAALELAGLDHPLPAVGECNNPLDYSSKPIASVPELRLLDAGDVTISSDAALVALAPRAFPSIASLASGVVYTSRDREEHSLPSSARYRVSVAGSDLVPRLALQGEAPEELSEVTLAGTPIEQVTEVAAEQPLDITWAVGDASDVVYVDLLPTSQAAEFLAVRCAFNDAQGAGSIPDSALEGLADEPVQLSLHRQRTIESVERSDDALSVEQRARLRFDFELRHIVEFVAE